MDSGVDPLRKPTASAADRNTAPAVIATLDLLTLDGLFKGFDAAMDLVGFRYSTFGGQDVCNLILKFNCVDDLLKLTSYAHWIPILNGRHQEFMTKNYPGSFSTCPVKTVLNSSNSEIGPKSRRAFAAD